MIELEKRRTIETLFRSNITSGAEIMRRTGIPKSTVYKVIEKLKSDNTIERKKDQGNSEK